MNTLIRLSDGTPLLTDPSYDGNCPECGFGHAVRNIREDHWGYCDVHRVKWRIGSNLYSGWTHESEATWRRNAAILSGYREVEPLYQYPGKADGADDGVSSTGDIELPW